VSELVVGYMDDVTVGGTGKDVTEDVRRFRQEGERIGLMLNCAKSEVITSQPQIPDEVKSFKRMEPTSASLLGAPIMEGSELDQTLQHRNADLRRAVDRLRSLPSHDSLVLIRSSLSVPKITHLLRCSPCSEHPALTEFDQTVRDGLCVIANSQITDSQWIQATLPVRDGGLGLRRASQLALPAFLASAASTSSLQARILANATVVNTNDSRVELYTLQWTSMHNLALPDTESSHLQRVWDAPSIVADKQCLSDSVVLHLDKARLLAVSAVHSSDWLHALPISACGLRLDDEAVRVAVGLRLGLSICEVHQCPCGATVDVRGTHGLSCRQSSARAARHQQLNDLIYRAIRQADVPAVKEPASLSRTDGKRPDGLTLVPWQRGRCLTWDVTVTDTLAESYNAISTTSPGAVAEAAAARKSAKYAELTTTHSFVPIAVETMGPICSEAVAFITELGRRLTLRTENPRETQFLFQRVSILIQRYNAVAFRGAFIEDSASDS